MTLTYQGARYMPAAPVMKRPDTFTEAIFLGVRYRLKPSQVDGDYQQPMQLTYRGIRYSR